MGIVYLAMVQGPAGFSKLVVVKELKPELVEEPSFLKMFLEEARLAARLNHSNIVQTNEVGNDGTRYFMAMDYLDGRGLERVRRRARHTNAPLSLSLQLRVLCDVLSGLEYAHSFTDFDGTPLGIVHRDVSPQNVFLTFEGQVKLLDFGIAKTIESANETRAGVLKGRLTYMAPEQARGERVDARADVFAVGVMLWEAVTGRALRQGQTEQHILGELVSRVEPPRAKSVNPDVPEMLDTICARALMPDRERRYHSAADLQNDLEQYMIADGRSVTARDLSTVMRELFKDDRARTNAMIDAHVARVRNNAATTDDDDLPVIDVSYSSIDMRTPVSTDTPATATGQVSAQRQVGTLDAPASIAQPKRKAMIVMPLVLVAGVGIGIFAYSKMQSSPSAAVAESKPAPTAPAPLAPAPAPPAPMPMPAPAPSPKLVEVDVHATPASAAIEIDGASVSGNPFHGKYVADGAMHQVRVTASGFAPKVTAVSFDAAVSLSIDLDRTTAAHSGSSSSHHHSPAPPPPPPVTPPPPPPDAPGPLPPTPKPDLNPSGGTKPHRTIDPNNPYAK